MGGFLATGSALSSFSALGIGEGRGGFAMPFRFSSSRGGVSCFTEGGSTSPTGIKFSCPRLFSFFNNVGAKTATIAWIRHEAISDEASFESFTEIMSWLYGSGTMTRPA